MNAKKNEDATRYEVEIFVEEDEGQFYAYAPALKGLHVGADTKEEAIQRAIDAAIGYVAVLKETGRPIPVGVICDEHEHPKPSATATTYRQEFALA